MIVVVYNHKQSPKPRVMHQVKGRHKWLIKVWAENEHGRSSCEHRNAEPIRLADILVTTIKSLHEVCEEVKATGEITNGGYEVIKL